MTNSKIKYKVLPSVKQYNTEEGQWKLGENAKIILACQSQDDSLLRWKEVAELVATEFFGYGAATRRVDVVFGEEKDALNGDILIKPLPNPDSNVSEESYIISVGETVKIEAISSNGLMYALRTVLQYQLLYQGMPFGKIEDSPEAEERILHLDMARKYYTPEWIKRLIRELSFLRLNTIQLHFSEHEGYRLECETYPDVMSDKYITKDEMRDILKEAERYGVSVIPAFDNPGHLLQAMKNYPQFRLKDVDGNYAKGALDINNDEAREYVRNFMKEYAELFKNSRYFHIGGDEFIDFNHFERYPSMLEYAKKHVPEGVEANGQDGYIAYMNEISEYTKELGFIPRIWNDGVYRRTPEAHLELHKYIEICYWVRKEVIAEAEEFLNRGHKMINSSDKLYYVLAIPESEYNEKPKTEWIFNTWNAGLFPGKKDNGEEQRIALPNPAVLGACYCIWSDHEETETEQQVQDGIFYSLRAMAQKCWAGDNADYPYEDFIALVDKLGKVK